MFWVVGVVVVLVVFWIIPVVFGGLAVLGAVLGAVLAVVGWCFHSIANIREYLGW